MRTNENEIINFLLEHSDLNLAGWQVFDRMGGLTHEEWHKFCNLLGDLLNSGRLLEQDCALKVNY